MSNIIKLTCLSAEPSTNGGFILKLQNKEDQVVASAFGTTIQKKQQTYYMKVGSNMVPNPAKANTQRTVVGVVADLDLDNYKVTEMPYVLPEGAENAGETVQLKWLFL